MCFWSPVNHIIWETKNTQLLFRFQRCASILLGEDFLVEVLFMNFFLILGWSNMGKSV